MDCCKAVIDKDINQIRVILASYSDDDINKLDTPILHHAINDYDIFKLLMTRDFNLNVLFYGDTVLNCIIKQYKSCKYDPTDPFDTRHAQMYEPYYRYIELIFNKQSAKKNYDDMYNCVKYMYTEKVLKNLCIHIHAVHCKNIALLDYCKINYNVIGNAWYQYVEIPDINIIDWIINNDYMPIPFTIRKLLKFNNLDLITYFYDKYIHIKRPIDYIATIVIDQPCLNPYLHRQTIYIKDDKLHGVNQQIFYESISYGNMPIIEWLRDRIPPVWSCGHAMTIAAENGYVHVIKWLYTHRLSKNTLTNVKISDAAAANGHIDVLEWLHAHEYVVSTNAIDEAAANGHIDVIKWLFNQKSTCTTKALTNAAKNNYFKIVKYIIKHIKIQYDFATAIASTKNSEIITYLSLLNIEKEYFTTVAKNEYARFKDVKDVKDMCVKQTTNQTHWQEILKIILNSNDINLLLYSLQEQRYKNMMDYNFLVNIVMDKKNYSLIKKFIQHNKEETIKALVNEFNPEFCKYLICA